MDTELAGEKFGSSNADDRGDSGDIYITCRRDNAWRWQTTLRKNDTDNIHTRCNADERHGAITMAIKWCRLGQDLVG